ncbi:MAG: DUF3267 domain-containing protein [Clostridia bacterium]|nr:DUF3267 domain-containing protein [Clostridia bacterium]
MLSTPTLPEGYREIYSVNLQKDKKVMLLLNLFSLLIGAALIVPVLFFKPISALFSMEKGMGSYLLRFAAIIVFSVVYLVLHELVHGVAMKLCGTKKVKYGFTGLYAFAGSTDFYGKGAYIFIALAPVVFWGIILAVITPLVNNEWFWVVYFVQVFNLSGAAGDLFVTFKFSRFPKDILISDNGVGMIVYSKE